MHHRGLIGFQDRRAIAEIPAVAHKRGRRICLGGGGKGRQLRGAGNRGRAADLHDRPIHMPVQQVLQQLLARGRAGVVAHALQPKGQVGAAIRDCGRRLLQRRLGRAIQRNGAGRLVVGAVRAQDRRGELIGPARVAVVHGRLVDRDLVARAGFVAQAGILAGGRAQVDHHAGQPAPARRCRWRCAPAWRCG